MPNKMCCVEGCSRIATVDGLCFRHHEIREIKTQNILSRQILSQLNAIEQRLISLESVLNPIYIPSVLSPDNKTTIPPVTTTSSSSEEWTVIPQNVDKLTP